LIVASKACIDWLDALRDSPSMDLHQGDCIELPPAVIGVLESLDPAEAVAQLFQVISVDQHGNRCWLRRWSLARRGSPVFEISLQQLQERARGVLFGRTLRLKVLESRTFDLGAKAVSFP
jgi:hypothetical protein